MNKEEKNKISKGLTSLEAKKSLDKFGRNEIKDTSNSSLVRIFLDQVKNNFVIYLLLFAMILSFFVGKNFTGYVIFAVILTVIITGFIQEYKAEKAIQALKNMLLPISIVIRDGKETEIPSSEIVPGDILILRTGEKVPADCLILEEKDLNVNESILTGESREVRKSPTKDFKKYSEEKMVFMGTFIVNGKCLVKVVSTGMQTRFGKIAGMISSTEKELPLQKKVNKIAKYMALFGGGFAILTGLIMLFRTPGFDYELFIEVLILVIAVAVASFPEGFPVVLITSLASGSYRMAKKNAIVNRMSIIETLGETTVICSDKTGTITKGEMTVKKIFSNNRLFEVTGSGYEGNGKILYSGKKVKLENEKSLNLLIKAGILCNDSRISRAGEDNNFNINGLPTEAALLILGAKNNLFKEDFNLSRLDEVPFSSERKIMSVLINEKDKNVYSKGALEIILKNSKYIQRNDGIFTLTQRDKKRILEENKKFTSSAFRTLGLAYKKFDSKNNFEKNLIFLGFVAIEDPAREEIKSALEICKQAGIKVKMITGDNRETALSIANQIGLDKGEILEGEELDKMDDKKLVQVVRNVVVFARVRPEHKLRIVQALKENGEIVTMTGDGVNDAPALKESHIGVAMGKNGTDVSRSVADLTLKDDNFATIVDAIKEGRTIFTNIQKFSAYQISVNFSQVALIFFAILIGLPLPLVAIQILFMNLFSDELTAITLAFNPYSGDVMNQRPRKKSSIITWPLFLMLAIAGLIMSFSSLSVFYYGLTIGKSEIVARTLTFLTMVFFGVANAFNFRSFRKKTINRSPFTNKYLVYVSIFAILSTLLIVYTPLSKILEVVSIRPIYLLIPLFVSLIVIFAIDFFKYLNEKKNFWTEDLQSFNFKN
jgi:P-type Ca2+ transporter type 2C